MMHGLSQALEITEAVTRMPRRREWRRVWRLVDGALYVAVAGSWAALAVVVAMVLA